jgi:UDP-glucose 4-epimerase
VKVLITGVAGFIGSNLAAALLKKGYSVVGVDNMSHGNPLNLSGFINHSAFDMHHIDVRDESGMIRAVKGCEVIVHLAAHKIPRYSDALDTLLVNVNSSENVLKAALENRSKIVAASTSDVYGKNPIVPFKETSDLVIGNPTIKRWAYAISKMYEEQLYFAYHDRYGGDIIILRFFGGYGPNQNLTWWGGPQSVFINSAIDDQEMEIHGDGQQARSFTYITDHIDGIIRAIENPAANNLIFNLGHTQEITIEALASLIWRLIRGEEPPRLRFIPYSAFGKYEDVQRRVPDINRAREILKFEPKVDLETGLINTIRWQIVRRKQLGIPTNPPKSWTI